MLAYYLRICLLSLIVFIGSRERLLSQDSIAIEDQILRKPEKMIAEVENKVSDLESKIDKASEKVLGKLFKQEQRLQRKLAKKDSLAAVQLFHDSKAKYSELKQKLRNNKLQKLAGKYYNPYLDSLKTSFKFLGDQGSITKSPGYAKLSEATSKIGALESKLQCSEEIRSFLRERRQMLKNKFSELGLVKNLKAYNKEVYYYAQRVKEYKSILKDRGKIEQEAIGVLRKLPAFKAFMQKYSELASMFPAPENLGSTIALNGLQSRSDVQQLLQGRLGNMNGMSQMASQPSLEQVVQLGKSNLEKLKQKLIDAGGLSSEDEVPDFKPNNQKTKSMWKRFEVGTNLQNSKANYLLPSSSDIGLSLGYKINDDGVIGIGAAYKVGWGSDIRKIRVSHEGLGLRSFIDWKLKGSFYVSGGYEQNYRESFRRFEELNHLSAWQQSGLIGISKIVSIKSKAFKKTKAQLYWDFLNNRKTTGRSSFVFRLGYHLN